MNLLGMMSRADNEFALRKTGDAEIDLMIPFFIKQLNTFRGLGKNLEVYIRGTRTMRSAMSHVHHTIIALCDPSWPKYNEFSTILEDQNELWNMLEKDIVNMGRGYKENANKFQHIMNQLEKHTLLLHRTDNLHGLLHGCPHHKTVERTQLTKKLQQTLDETAAVVKEIQILFKEVKNKQQAFLQTHYSQFLEAHIHFCKDSLQILSFIPEVFGCMIAKPVAKLSPTLFQMPTESEKL